MPPSAILYLLVICCIQPNAGQQTTKSSLYSNIHMDDKIFSEDLSFEYRSRSAIDCVGHCSTQEGCLTVTYHRGTCRGHSTLMTSSKTSTTAPGAKSFARTDVGVASSHPSYALDTTPTDASPPDSSPKTYTAAESEFVWPCSVTGVKQTSPYPWLGLDGQVFCEDDWIVFLRRQDGSVDFYRNWENYTKGFGDVNGEYWLGLEAIHKITQAMTCEMRADMKDWVSKTAYSVYSSFSLGPASEKYILFYNHQSSGNVSDSMIDHKGNPFSTPGNDSSAGFTTTCKGAWWYGYSTSVNFCGVYKNSTQSYGSRDIFWTSFSTIPLQFAQMKIRPSN